MKVTIHIRRKSETRTPNTYIQPNNANNIERNLKPSHWATRYKHGIELINSRKLLKSASKSKSFSINPDQINLSTKYSLAEIPKIHYLRKRPKKSFQSLQLSFQNSWVKLPYKSIQLNLKGQMVNNLTFTNEP